MITFYIDDIFTADVNMQVHNVGRLFPRLSTRRLGAAQCSVGDETSPRQHVLCLPRSLTSTDIATRDQLMIIITQANFFI